jgi:hypothetical protein
MDHPEDERATIMEGMDNDANEITNKQPEDQSSFKKQQRSPSSYSDVEVVESDCNDNNTIESAVVPLLRSKRARNSSHVDVYQTAYEAYDYQSTQFTFIPTNSSILIGGPTTSDATEKYTHPGTPLCLFKASYHVTSSSMMTTWSARNSTNDCNNSTTSPIILIPEMMVHQHVNGLCIVTVASNMERILQQMMALRSHTNTTTNSNSGSSSSSDHVAVQCNDRYQFQYHVQETPSEMSTAQKRKRNTKQLQGHLNPPKQQQHNQSRVHLKKNNDYDTVTGVVRPSDILATIRTTSLPSQTTTGAAPPDVQIQFPSCVLGSIIELNHQFTHAQGDMMQLLRKDPFLTGYLAIILPSGPFPPRK